MTKFACEDCHAEFTQTDLEVELDSKEKTNGNL